MATQKSDTMPTRETPPDTPHGMERTPRAVETGAVGTVPWTLAQTLLGTAIMLVPWVAVQLSSKATTAASSPGKPVSFAADLLGGIIALVFSAIVEGAFLLVPAYYTISRRAPGTTIREGLDALGLRRTDPRPAAVAGAVGLSIIIAVNLIYSALITAFHWNIQTNSDSLSRLAQTMPLTLMGYLAAAVLVAPICEEIFFRGFVFGGLLRGMSLWPAALISAALFGIAHVDAGSFPVLLVIGIVLAYVRWRFGSLWPGIALHACNNAIAALLIIGALAR